jgi:hypothetical protein
MADDRAAIVKLTLFLTSHNFRYVHSHKLRLRSSGIASVAYVPGVFDPEQHVFFREGRGYSAVVTVRHFMPHINYGDVNGRFHFVGLRWQFMRRSARSEFASDHVDQFIGDIGDWLAIGQQHTGAM